MAVTDFYEVEAMLSAQCIVHSKNFLYFDEEAFLIVPLEQEREDIRGKTPHFESVNLHPAYFVIKAVPFFHHHHSTL